MPLTRLIIHHLRNISHQTLLPVPGVNLIVGPNGSGKTSLLEACFLLGRARSFRSGKQKAFIQQGEKKTTIFGQVCVLDTLAPVSAGISRALDGSREIRVGGRNVNSTAALLELLPIQLIEPETFRLLNAGPTARRQFLDWGVFHVEQGFFSCWQRLNRCLKQRNMLLRRGKIEDSLQAVWDREFVEISTEITRQRARYMAQFNPLFEKRLQELLGVDGVTVSFYAGWNQDKDLAVLLRENRLSDLKRGFTRTGPQRADLKISYLGQPAGEVLSRGQQKLVICALKLAQGDLYFNVTGRACIYLLDDLAAELDAAHREKLCQLLAQINCQLFITSVDSESYANYWPSTDVKVFHVEQGTIVS